MQHSPELLKTTERQTRLNMHVIEAASQREGQYQAAPAEALCDSRPKSWEHTELAEEHTKISAKPIALVEDTAAPQEGQVMDRSTHARQSEHSKDHTVAAAASDATTVTGDDARDFAALEGAATRTDEVQSLKAAGTPQQCSFDPPALITPDTVPDTDKYLASASAAPAVAKATDQSHETAAGQYGEPVDVKQPDGEQLHGAARPPTTRQIASAARTMLSLSRGDATSSDTAAPSANRAAMQPKTACRQTENGVLPPQTPAKAKEIDNLAALLAGDVAARGAGPSAPSAAAAIARARQQRTPGSSSAPDRWQNDEFSGTALARGVHSAARRSHQHSSPIRNGQNEVGPGRMSRLPWSLPPTEGCPQRVHSVGFPAAEHRDHYRAPRYSCAGHEMEHERDFYRSAGAVSDVLASVKCTAPLGHEGSRGAPARLRRSRAGRAGPGSTLPADDTLVRPPCYRACYMALQSRLSAPRKPTV